MKINTTKIKVLLAERNESIKVFCENNNLSYSTVIALLNKKRNGNLKTIGKLAKALNVKVEDLLED